MTKANDLASLLDANGDVVSSALDNVPASDLVNDTTPQLGGNLDLNSNNITGTGNLDVTGTVTADGLIVQGNSGTSNSVVFGYNENGGEITLHDETGAVATLFDQAANNTRLLELVNGSDLVLGLGGSNTTGNIRFNSAGYSTAMTIDSSGSVDISNSSGATLKLTSTDVTGADTELLGQIDFVSSDTSGGSAGTQARIKGVYEDNGDSSGIAFLTGYSTGSGSPTINEVMRLRHEGTVLVGKTSSGYNVDGFETHQNGETYVSRSGTPFAINRNSSDGTLLNLYKDGSTVGSIGSRSGVASYIVLDPRNATGNGGSGLTGVGDVIRPTNYTGGQTDNHVSLGSSAARFKDLYLSGGVVFGDAGGSGTPSSNSFDSYEEGSWTASFAASTTTATGYYTKVGATVFFTVYGYNLNVTSTGSSASISGLPFTNNGGFTAFNITHDTYTNNSYNGYINSGGTIMYPIQDGTVSVATTVAGNPKYIMVSGTYITDS